jgi:hypothetical protein
LSFLIVFGWASKCLLGPALERLPGLGPERPLALAPKHRQFPPGGSLFLQPVLFVLFFLLFYIYCLRFPLTTWLLAHPAFARGLHPPPVGASLDAVSISDAALSGRARAAMVRKWCLLTETN